MAKANTNIDDLKNILMAIPNKYFYNDWDDDDDLDEYFYSDSEDNDGSDEYFRSDSEDNYDLATNELPGRCEDGYPIVEYQIRLFDVFLLIYEIDVLESRDSRVAEYFKENNILEEYKSIIIKEMTSLIISYGQIDVNLKSLEEDNDVKVFVKNAQSLMRTQSEEFSIAENDWIILVNLGLSDTIFNEDGDAFTDKVKADMLPTIGIASCLDSYEQ